MKKQQIRTDYSSNHDRKRSYYHTSTLISRGKFSHKSIAWFVGGVLMLSCIYYFLLSDKTNLVEQQGFQEKSMEQAEVVVSKKIIPLTLPYQSSEQT